MHHVNTRGTYQNWKKGELITPVAFQPIGTTIFKDYSVSQDQSYVAILYEDLVSSIFQKLLLQLNTTDLSVITSPTSSETSLAAQVYTDGLEIYTLTNAVSNTLFKANINGNPIDQVIVNTNTKMAVSPDGKKILLWTDLSTVQLFDTTLNFLS